MEAQLAPRPRRPRPKLVTLTDAAAERVREILSARPEASALRVGVKNGGCAGSEYTVDYARGPEPLDEVVEDKGVTILVEPKAVLFLVGSEIDYVTTFQGSGFTFNNPNASGGCGCGSSFTV